MKVKPMRLWLIMQKLRCHPTSPGGLPRRCKVGLKHFGIFWTKTLLFTFIIGFWHFQCPWKAKFMTIRQSPTYLIFGQTSKETFSGRIYLLLSLAFVQHFQRSKQEACRINLNKGKVDLDNIFDRHTHRTPWGLRRKKCSEKCL